MAVPDNNNKEFSEYLKHLCESHPNGFKEEHPLVICVTPKIVRTNEEDIEGWTIEWTLNFLISPPNRVSKFVASPPESAANSQDGVASVVSESQKEPQHRPCPWDLATLLARATANSILKADHSDIKIEEGYLDAFKLARKCLNSLLGICDTWKQQFPSLSVPPTLSNRFAWHAIKNGRRKMEDRHCILPHLHVLYNLEESPRQSYFSVFDGHGGAQAAAHASAHLHRYIVNHPSFDRELPKAITESISQLDEDYCQHIAPKDGGMAGAVGVVAVVRERELHVAWLGDCQAVLVEDGAAVQLTQPHKPENPEERKRIEEKGGCVVYLGTWRVNGNLAVSRAIGDASQKDYIPSTAEVMSCDMDGTEDYLVLACDGFWDVIGVDALPGLVHQASEEGVELEKVPEYLVEYARQQGSRDNITVVMVFFRDALAAPLKAEDDYEGVQNRKDAGGATDRHHRSTSPRAHIYREPDLNSILRPSNRSPSHEMHRKATSSGKSKVIIRNPKGSNPTFETVPTNADISDYQAEYTRRYVEQSGQVGAIGSKESLLTGLTEDDLPPGYMYHPWMLRPMLNVDALKAKRTSLPMHMFWSYQGLSPEERRKLQQIMHGPDGVRTSTFITEVKWDPKTFVRTYPAIEEFTEKHEEISKEFNNRHTNHRLNYYSLGALPRVASPSRASRPPSYMTSPSALSQALVPAANATHRPSPTYVAIPRPLSRTASMTTSVKQFGSPRHTEAAKYRLHQTHRPRRWPRPRGKEGGSVTGGMDRSSSRGSGRSSPLTPVSLRNRVLT